MKMETSNVDRRFFIVTILKILMNADIPLVANGHKIYALVKEIYQFQFSNLAVASLPVRWVRFVHVLRIVEKKQYGKMKRTERVNCFR
ncbi:TPA: hypothetical protein DIV55_01970 [Patescibacteria group bacterium]|nr:hypothetical protein [Patescibacteria group bacterium]